MVESTVPACRLQRGIAPALCVALLLVMGLAAPGAAHAVGWRVGFGLCHQLPEHSFVFGGVQLPFCARCTGTFGAFLLTLLALAAVGRGRRTGLPTRRVGIVIAVVVALMAVDGVNSLLDLASAGAVRLYAPSNWLRLATGWMYGTVLALVIAPVLANALWLLDDPRPVLGTLRGAPAIPLAALAATGVVAAAGKLLAGALALASTAGALAALTMVNATALLMVTGRGQRARRRREAAWPMVGGLVIGVIELAVLSAVRMALWPLVAPA